MERLKVDAAVIVTTPQRLSFVDVVKGVEMFDKAPPPPPPPPRPRPRRARTARRALTPARGGGAARQVGIPSVAVVENMAYLEPLAGELGARLEAFAAKHELTNDAAAELRELLGERQLLFGAGHRQRLLDMWGIANSYSVPLAPALTAQADQGVPFVLAAPTSPIAETYATLAKDLVREVPPRPAPRSPRRADGRGTDGARRGAGCCAQRAGAAPGGQVRLRGQRARDRRRPARRRCRPPRPLVRTRPPPPAPRAPRPAPRARPLRA
jgi:hypothetical protein